MALSEQNNDEGKQHTTPRLVGPLFPRLAAVTVASRASFKRCPAKIDRSEFQDICQLREHVETAAPLKIPAIFHISLGGKSQAL